MPFAIADRFSGVSPDEVGEWDEGMVADALERMQAERLYHERAERKRRAKAD